MTRQDILENLRYLKGRIDYTDKCVRELSEKYGDVGNELKALVDYLGLELVDNKNYFKWQRYSYIKKTDKEG